MTNKHLKITKLIYPCDIIQIIKLPHPTVDNEIVKNSFFQIESSITHLFYSPLFLYDTTAWNFLSLS